MQELITTSISADSPSHFALSNAIGSAIDFLRYLSHDFWNDSGDPRVMKLPLMDSGPWSTISLIFTYLYFVKVAGPQMMKGRKPLDLRGAILAYNVLLVLLNGWFFYTGCWLSNFGVESWKCQPVDYASYDPLDLYKIQIGWYFLMSKFIDLADTVFFVLRKKDSQITTLHVIHHSLMPVFTWAGVKFAAGGNSGFFPWINSGVHTIMYTYYALSTFDSLKPYLWWKKYITKIQMIQFILVIVHSIYSMLIPGCAWPRVFMYLSIFNAFLFLGLFYSFFQKSYVSSFSGNGRNNSSNRHHLSNGNAHIVEQNAVSIHHSSSSNVQRQPRIKKE